METKILEVRDRGTFIPILAVRLLPSCEAERYLLGRAGYGTTEQRHGQYVYLVRIAGGSGAASCDYIDWARDGTRTLSVAHEHIINNWEGLPPGSVVDVEFILGETEAPKISERLTARPRHPSLL